MLIKKAVVVLCALLSLPAAGSTPRTTPTPLNIDLIYELPPLHEGVLQGSMLRAFLVAYSDAVRLKEDINSPLDLSRYRVFAKKTEDGYQFIFMRGQLPGTNIGNTCKGHWWCGDMEYWIDAEFKIVKRVLSQ